MAKSPKKITTVRQHVRHIPTLLFFLVSACSTSSFKIIKRGDLAVELKVTPDRILLECEYLYHEDEYDVYGFMMHVLDEENTVLTVAQTNVLDKGSCYKRINKISKILNTGKTVYMGSMGLLNKPKIKENKTYTFPKLGTFHGNGLSTQFMVVLNENGLCYDAQSGDKEDCPQKPFKDILRH